MTERATLTIPEAALLLGVSRGAAYEEVKQSGTLVGVRVLKVGSRPRLVIPAAPFRRMLGLEEEMPDA